MGIFKRAERTRESPTPGRKRNKAFLPKRGGAEGRLGGKKDGHKGGKPFSPRRGIDLAAREYNGKVRRMIRGAEKQKNFRHLRTNI